MKSVSALPEFSGQLERVDADGVIEGWCWSRQTPDVPAEIEIRCAGVVLATARCTSVRPDLAAYGVGEHPCGFLLVLEDIGGCGGEISLHERHSCQRIGAPMAVVGPAPVGATMLLGGNLDGVSQDGLVTGWCWDALRPNAHLSLAVFVDQRQVGVAPAVLFRPDLLDAGIGDGTHGFSFALPWSALEGRGRVSVAVRCADTGQALADPVEVRLGSFSEASDRLAEFERQIRRMAAEIETLSAALDRKEAAAPAKTMFATLGALFGELADSADPAGLLGHAAPDLSLRHAVEGLRVRHAPFALAISPAPLATIVIPAGDDLATLVRCLQALHSGGIDRAADIVVLDDGSGPADMALLGSLVANIRLQRLSGPHERAAAMVQLARSGRGALLAYLSPKLRPAADWLDRLVESFAETPEAALIGGRVVGEDGLLRHLCLAAGADGGPEPIGVMDDAARPSLCHLREVEAVGALGFAVRPALLLACGGFGAAEMSPGEAVLDLCLRLRAAGHPLLVQPYAEAVCDDGEDFADFPCSEALRVAWQARAPLPHCVGQALVIDTALPHPDRDAGSLATLEHLQLLRRLGYHVRFAATDGIDAASPEAIRLERLGIELVRAPEAASITGFLLRHGADLDVVQVWRHRNASLFIDRVRALAPRARFVFSPADLHHLREDRHAALAEGGRSDAGAAALRASELACISAADVTLVHSDAEWDLLSPEVGPNRLQLLRWIARPNPAPRDFAERSGIGFIGHFRHSPNEDGLRWLLSDIMPRLRATRPGLVLHIAGHDLPADLAALASSEIVVHGGVDDLAGFFAGLRLSVAPLRFGAGFKGKVATSLSFGVPVVGTGIAAEGTGLRDGDGITIADDAAAFARAVALLHDSEAQWRTQASRAVERCEALYAPEAALAVYRGMLGAERSQEVA